MKFNDVKKIQEENKSVQVKRTTKEDNQRGVIEQLLRYNNVGVYVMKNGKKGLFREIATYINDGISPTSWALKVSNADGWSIQFGVNPNVDFSTNDIYLGEMLSVFEQKYDVNVMGNKKVVLITNFKGRQEVEEVGNYIINMFKDIELDFIDSKILPEFNTDGAEKPFKIVGFYSENKVDEQSHNKFKDIVDKFKSIKMSSEDTIIFKKIKNKLSNDEVLNDGDRNRLNDLMKDYFSTHERVSIAMKYLRKD